MIVQNLKFILKHPIAQKNKWQALRRFFLWQMGYRFIPYPVVYPFIEKSKLIVSKGMTGATGNIYTGLHDFEEMGFVLHFLRPEDLFIDIGANIGSYTILASSVIGSDSFCFEPVPSTFNSLTNNLLINHLSSKVTAFNIGLGDFKGSIKFSSMLDTVNHVLSNNEENIEFIEVPVALLDDYCFERSPSLVKIDVEGFEYQVLQGGKNVLANPILKAIIIELNGSGGRYGIADGIIHQYLLSFGFKPINYEPFKRNFNELTSFKCNRNTIYIRDFDYVNQRVKNQRIIEIHSVKI